MPPNRLDWADAYARQGASDLRVYKQWLAVNGVPVCHKLHYLQMACEKLAKAYLLRYSSASEESLRTSHVAFPSFIEAYYASARVRHSYIGRTAQLKSVKRGLRNIAREIEKLAPAVDRKQTPSNAEYPWESHGRVIAPCDYSFPNLSSLWLYKGTGTGMELRKVVEDALSDLGVAPLP